MARHNADLNFAGEERERIALQQLAWGDAAGIAAALEAGGDGGEPSGFDVILASDVIYAPEAHAALRADFSIRDELGAVGFPSLALWDGRRGRVLTRGWVDLQTARAALDSAELLSR